MIADEVVPGADIDAAVDAGRRRADERRARRACSRTARRCGWRTSRSTCSAATWRTTRASRRYCLYSPALDRQPRAQLGREAQAAVSDDRPRRHPRADARSRDDDDLRQPGLDRAALLQGRARRLPLRARAAGVVGRRDGRRLRAGDPQRGVREPALGGRRRPCARQHLHGDAQPDAARDHRRPAVRASCSPGSRSCSPSRRPSCPSRT